MSSTVEGSVTVWIGHLKAGDHAAAHQLWMRYYDRIVRLARRRLRAFPAAATVEDEEDAALDAFESLCKGAVRGGFERLNDRDDLLQILTLITARKVVDQIKRQRRHRRGGGRVVGEAALDVAGGGDRPGGLDQFPGRFDEPGPALIAAEECARLLDGLGDESLRQIAILRMDGHTAEEIAERLGCSLRTVFNKLKLIRMKWDREASAEDDRDA
jgi:RNA polymerase sigma factor (sigma-70 family)